MDGADLAVRAQEAESDNFEHWEKLIRACEGLEGGLNRNSSPQALATLRDSYDRFLLKFPLLFGYWKKYADLEFNISGPESAEMVCRSSAVAPIEE
jgi:pre-mRNA-processing factor 39